MDIIAENFYKLFGRTDLFTQATEEELERLENLFGKKVNKILDFYRKYQPYDVPMTDSYVSLPSIDRIIIENTNGYPGEVLAEFAVFVFATTVGGNVLCIDTNSAKDGDAPVLLADSSFSSCKDYNELLENVTKIEDSFLEFMLKLSRNEYEDIEEYLPC